MKKKLMFIKGLIFIMALSCSTCFADIVKETRNIGNFSQLVLRGAAKVHVTQGQKNSLVLKTEKDNLQNIKINVTDNILTIETDYNRKWWYKFFDFKKDVNVEVYIIAKNINKITSSGATKINIDNINNQELTLTLSGSTCITISGKSKLLKINASGATKILTRELKARTADINCSGSVNAELFASKKIKMKISGAGKIIYYGNPKVVESNISGAATIRNGEK